MPWFYCAVRELCRREIYAFTTIVNILAETRNGAKKNLYKMNTQNERKLYYITLTCSDCFSRLDGDCVPDGCSIRCTRKKRTAGPGKDTLPFPRQRRRRRCGAIPFQTARARLLRTAQDKFPLIYTHTHTHENTLHSSPPKLNYSRHYLHACDREVPIIEEKKQSVYIFLL